MIQRVFTTSLTACCWALPLMLLALPATAANFTVDSTADDPDDDTSVAACADVNGNCTLRAAIQQINFTADPSNTIEFNIPGGGAQTISPTTSLPDIRYQTTIDGTTQPGWVANTTPFFASNATLTVILDGSNAGGGSDGLSIDHFTDPTQLSEGSIVRGLVIINFGDAGLQLVTGYNRVEGNFIGIAADGSTAAGNSGDGISITTGSMVGGFNIIGGQTDPTLLNVISGNDEDGIHISGTSTFNEIRRNVIGASASGLTDVGNGGDGIDVSVGTNNQIGGLVVHSSNLISGNAENGIRLGTALNTVEGNFIGVDATGLLALANDDHGIAISGPNNTIGLPLNLQIIAGNGGYGISIGGGSATSNSVIGNLIGVVNPLVAMPLGNGCSGILITSADNEIGRGTIPFDVGTGVPGEGNLIGGATDDDPNNNCQNPSGHGLEIRGSSATGNLIVGNYIGVDFNEAVDVGNLRDGITLDFSATNNQIGDGTDLGANRIDFNGDLGIDLDNDGPDTNDLLDPDGGENDGQNYPIIDSAITAGGTTTVSGTLNSLASTSFLIQVFSSPTADGSGFGEGRRFEGSTTVSTDVTGDGSWMISVSSPDIEVGRVVTTTATVDDPNPSSTSEFSEFRTVTSPGEIQFVSATHMAGEGIGMATISVERVNGTAGAVSVDYASADGTAIAGSDYSAAMGTLSWGDGVGGTMNFQVPLTDDLLDEDIETVMLALTNATGGATLGMPTMAELQIGDDDAPPTVSIADLSMAEGNAGATNFDFVVSLSAVSGLTVDVDVDTADDSATAPADYAATSTSLQFLPGETMMTASVAVVGDTAPELDETFFVNLSNAVNATLGDGQAIGTISDDDMLPAASIDDVSLAEGSGGGTTAFVFTVSLDTPPAAPVSVDFTTADGSAVAGSDYTAISGTVNFMAADVSETVQIDVVADDVSEANESFFVDLSNPSGLSIADAQGEGMVVDDDGTPQLMVDDLSIAEGNAGTTPFIFTVSLTPASSSTVTVDVATSDGSAMAPSDYASVPVTTVQFLAGESLQTVQVDVVGDTVAEADEAFFLDLTNPTGGASISDAQGQATILDDEAAPELSIDDVSLAEGDAGSTAFVFTVSLSAASSNTVEVDVASADDTATAGSDYNALAAMTLTFMPGDTSMTVQVDVLGDLVSEPAETFLVNLSNATGGATIADGQGVGTIQNDDGDPTLTVDDVMMAEGDAGVTAFVFTIMLTPASSALVEVDVATADDTATAGSDYVAIPATTVQLMPGATSATVQVDVIGDTVSESNETFFLDLSNASAGAMIGDAQGIGTIIDDEGAPQLFIDDVSVVEGDAGMAAMTFTVSLSSASASPVTVDFATVDGTATVAGNDYQATSGTVTFAPPSVSESIVVMVNGDSAVEADETLTVLLSNPSGAILADDQGLGTIQNDDMMSTTADLTLTSMLNPAQAMVGDIVTLALQIVNDGPDPATGVVLSVVLPTEVGYVSGPPACSEMMGVVSCALGGLAAGDMTDIVLMLEALADGSAAIVASVSANEDDPMPGNSSASTTLVIGDPLAIPTLDRVALALLVLLLGAAGWLALSRQRG